MGGEPSSKEGRNAEPESPVPSPSEASPGIGNRSSLVFVAGPTCHVDFNCAGVGTWGEKESLSSATRPDFAPRPQSPCPFFKAPALGSHVRVPAEPYGCHRPNASQLWANREASGPRALGLGSTGSRRTRVTARAAATGGRYLRRRMEIASLCCAKTPPSGLPA